tara:strand:- start:982 stop:1218 length:237 start_codon:yes stop_codon:yes gene_type:complete
MLTRRSRVMFRTRIEIQSRKRRSRHQKKKKKKTPKTVEKTMKKTSKKMRMATRFQRRWYHLQLSKKIRVTVLVLIRIR